MFSMLLMRILRLLALGPACRQVKVDNGTNTTTIVKDNLYNTDFGVNSIINLVRSARISVSS